jgi:hypothetical protein
LHLPEGATNSTILAKLTYALPATTLSKAECEKITRRLIYNTLSKDGINPHMPRDMVFGSPQRLGLGYPDLYVIQGAQAVSRVLSFGTGSPSITSTLIRISYELICIETGLEHPLDEEFETLGDLATPCFFTSIWEFISTYKIKLQGPSNPVARRREHDSMIMDVLKENLDKAERVLFNRCRIYLQVSLVSDITTADGKYISWYAARGLADITRPSRWRWPKQGKPSNQAWLIWHKGINSLGSKERSGKRMGVRYKLQPTPRYGNWTALRPKTGTTYSEGTGTISVMGRRR